MRKPWSDSEIGAIEVYYPRYGPMWVGWSEVLPGRNQNAIKAKAVKMGIQCRHRGRRPKGMEDDFELAMADPMERVILRKMGDGMTPSEIDAEMKWPPGRAILVLTEKWARESGKHGDKEVTDD